MYGKHGVPRSGGHYLLAGWVDYYVYFSTGLSVVVVIWLLTAARG